MEIGVVAKNNQFHQNLDEEDNNNENNILLNINQNHTIEKILEVKNGLKLYIFDFFLLY